METVKRIVKAVVAAMMVLVLVMPVAYAPMSAEAAETGGFYYNMLDATGKKVYKAIEEQITVYPNRGVSLDMKASEDQVYLAAECYLLDNPQVYWLYQDILVYYAGEKVCYIEYGKIDCNEVAFNAFVKEIVEEADCYAEDYFRIRSVYEEIIKRVIYDVNADNIYMNQTTYSGVTGKSVCMGASKLFMHCLSALGYDSMVVLTETHAFNYVKLNGKWYAVDLTAEGIYDKETGEVSLKYFMLGKKSAGYIKEKYLYTYPKLASKDYVKEAVYKKLTGKKQYTTWSEWEYSLESQANTLPKELLDEETVDLYFWYTFGDPSPANTSPYWNVYKNGRLLVLNDYHEYFIEVPYGDSSGSSFYVNSYFSYLDYSGPAIVREAASNHQYYSTEVSGIRIFPHNSRQVVKAYKFRTRELVE